MLKMCVFIPLVLLSCSAMAMEKEIISTNHIGAGQLSEDASESRACGGCGGGTVKPPTIITKDPTDFLPIILSFLGSLPVLAFHVLGLILLGVLLKHLLTDKSGPPATDPYYFSGQSYADPFTSAGPGGYSKRSSPGQSSWSLRDIQESPFVTFLTQFVTDAIDKYNVIEEH